MTTDPKITNVIQDEMYTIRGWNAAERKQMRVDTLAGIREWIKISIDEAREEIAARQRDAGPSLPTEADHRTAFFAASCTVAHWARATDKQIDYLARLAAESGERTTFSGHLTQREASSLINDYQRG
jgi:hypothetical protein